MAKAQQGIRKIFKTLGVAASALATGIVAGLMLAPKSGKETRADIKKGVKDTSDKIEDKLDQMKKDVHEKVEKYQQKSAKKDSGQ